LDNTINTIHRKVLEIGCGVAPTVSHSDDVVYSDLSFTAVKYLKKERNGACCVVADCTNLPFRSDVFSNIVASEVLEHIENDDEALEEMARTIRRNGQSIITVPHRKFYFAVDDRYVAHYRRYEIDEIKTKLLNHGLKTVKIDKVLGPLEKITMWLVTGLLLLIQNVSTKKQLKQSPQKIYSPKILDILVPFYKIMNKYYAVLALLDTQIMPMALSTVLIVKSRLSK
jgi:SAM-dependent methyltransferase